jgi:GxxExxY protein
VAAAEHACWRRNRIAGEVVDAALKLDRHFGPSIYESVYEAVRVYDLTKRNLTSHQQTPVPLIYKGMTFEAGFKTDVIVNDLVILELKSVEKLEPVYFSQLLILVRLHRAAPRTSDQLRSETVEGRYPLNR